VNKGLEAARAARLANKDKPRVKKPSMRKAINDFCKECSYDPLSAQGTWRQQVEACTSPKCPLYELRPVSTVKKDTGGDI
jgi:hypothetical protein